MEKTPGRRSTAVGCFLVFRAWIKRLTGDSWEARPAAPFLFEKPSSERHLTGMVAPAGIYFGILMGVHVG